MNDLPDPDRLVTLADGRRIAFDDRGDPTGTPVLYLHGTPDTRLARHPDDGIATSLGVRLLAADRPGVGGSDPDPGATPISVAADLVAALDHLGVDEVALLAWSAGSIFALALAGAHRERVASLTLVAPLVPADAYSDSDVLDGADDARRLFADALPGSSPDELGRELAMWLVPPEIDDATATAMLAGTLAEVAHIDGADRMLIDSLQVSVAGGLAGLEREIAAQATPLGNLFDAVTAPVSIHVGTDDCVAPVAMSRWLCRRLGAALDIHDGAGHGLAITGWRRWLTDAVQTVVAPEAGASGSTQSTAGTSPHKRSSS